MRSRASRPLKTETWTSVESEFSATVRPSTVTATPTFASAAMLNSMVLPLAAVPQPSCSILPSQPPTHPAQLLPSPPPSPRSLSRPVTPRALKLHSPSFKPQPQRPLVELPTVCSAVGVASGHQHQHQHQHEQQQQQRIVGDPTASKRLEPTTRLEPLPPHALVSSVRLAPSPQRSRDVKPSYQATRTFLLPSGQQLSISQDLRSDAGGGAIVWDAAWPLVDWLVHSGALRGCTAAIEVRGMLEACDQSLNLCSSIRPRLLQISPCYRHVPFVATKTHVKAPPLLLTL